MAKAKTVVKSQTGGCASKVTRIDEPTVVAVSYESHVVLIAAGSPIVISN